MFARLCNDFKKLPLKWKYAVVEIKVCIHSWLKNETSLEQVVRAFSSKQTNKPFLNGKI